ncbi:hypothetical protein BH24ACT5_BH24ACT5_27210 [soil metagenome]
MEGDIADLIERCRRYNVSPAAASLLHLSLFKSSHRMMPGSGGPIPLPLPAAYAHGPNVVVLYDTGNIEDLCLTWALRGAHGHGGRLPLALPRTETLMADLCCIKDERMWSWTNFAAPDIALTSCTIPTNELQEIARDLGRGWAAHPATALAQAPHPAVRMSGDVALLHQGAGRVPTWSPADEELFRYLGGDLRKSMHTTFALDERRLPPIRSIAGGSSDHRRYRHGGVQLRADQPGTVARLRWPAGWTILEGAFRDRDLRVRQSVAGRAAEAIMRTCGSMADLQMLATPEAITLAHRLTERQGISFFRQRLRDVGQEQPAEDPTVRTADADDARALTFNEIRQILTGDRDDADAWLEWAEARRLVVRGVSIHCARCGGRSWTPLADAGPPVTCRGCAQPIDKPYPSGHLEFQYRCGEMLRQLFVHDALVHVLAIRWLASLLRSGSGIGAVYGFHPGVEIVEGDRVTAEIDIVAILSNGEIAIGEGKRFAPTLTTDVLDRFDALADQVGSPWTFYATLNPAADSMHWETLQRRQPDRPRFMLTRDHLCERYPRETVGSDPFAWATADDESYEAVGKLSNIWFGLTTPPDDDTFLIHDYDRRLEHETRTGDDDGTPQRSRDGSDTRPRRNI